MGGLMAAKKKSFDFEHALEELEQLVTLMESGNMPLEESLKAFEQGVKLTRECQQALLDAEQKVALLLQRGTGAELQSFTLNTDECP
jgi:exodeoxyribonuclease VII small subunit